MQIYNLMIGFESPMAFYHDFYSSMVYWDNNIRPDMGPLYFYHIWSFLYEDNIRLQYTNGLFYAIDFFSLYIKKEKKESKVNTTLYILEWTYEWSSIFVQLPFFCCVLLCSRLYYSS